MRALHVILFAHHLLHQRRVCRQATIQVAVVLERVLLTCETILKAIYSLLLCKALCHRLLAKESDVHHQRKSQYSRHGQIATRP